MEPLNLSLAHCIHGKPELAVPILEAEAAKGNIAAKFNLGWHRLREGKFKEGYEGLNYGRWIQVFGNGVPVSNTDIPRPEDDVAGKSLLFNSEGGLGDEIANVRFAIDYIEAGANVTITCSEQNLELFRYLKTDLPYKVVERGSPLGKFDYWVPAMSAPYTLDKDYSTLSGAPYLNPSYSKWDRPEGFNVAFKWSGNPEFEHEQHRVFPEQMMFDLTKDDRINVFSLQKEYDNSGLPRLDMNNLCVTAKSLAHMDLVITSCSSTAHLSGALGIETWVIIPIMPYFMWALPGDTSPWYDSVKLFRQTEYGSWDEPFERIRNELDGKLQSSL
jgi:hypothetical protein